MNSIVLHRFSSLVGLMSAIVIIGTAGYALIEGWKLFDGLYMTLITISTVGYGEIQDLSTVGRVFTSVLIAMSMVAMVFWTAGVTSILVSGDLNGEFQRRKERKVISKLSKHSIVCGGGIMARTIIAGLVKKQKNVVAIVEEADQILWMRRFFPDLPIIEADPKNELSLADANVLDAKYLIAAMESDYDNLLITIAGKSLGTDIRIVSCAISNELATKILKVGADDVICPMVLGGEHATSLICEHDEALALA